MQDIRGLIPSPKYYKTLQNNHYYNNRLKFDVRKRRIQKWGFENEECENEKNDGRIRTENSKRRSVIQIFI